MPAPQRLQVVPFSPSAQPVNTFLQGKDEPDPTPPARPSLLPQTPRVTSLQRGGQRDVQGVNPIDELNQALAPLSKLYDAGVEMYASNEYRQGQNEILRAAANVNRDMMEKSLLYAAQNREVDRSNPIAGVLMDQANPFRQAGRVNQASRWVAMQTSGQFRAEWTRMAGALQALDPSNPAVTGVQAKITNQLTNAFGLDEFSPGFQQYVLPEINKSWEWFQKQQLDAHVKYQKAVASRQTSDLMLSALTTVNDIGPEKWIEIIAEQMAHYGLSGEPQKMTREAILMTAQRLRLMMTDPATRQTGMAGLTRLFTMPSGIFDKNGQPISVRDAYAIELLEDQAEMSRDVKTIRDNRKAAANDELEMDPAFDNMIGVDPQSPMWQVTYDQLRADPRYAALSGPELRQKMIEQSELADKWQAVTYDPIAVDGFILQQEESFGSNWNEGQANAQFQQIISGAPQGERRRLQERWRQLREDKRREQRGEIDTALMNDIVDKKTRALVAQMFPSKGPEILRWMKANPNGDLVGYLGSVDAQKAEVIEASRRQYRAAGTRAIREQSTAGQLPPERQAEIWEEVWKRDKDTYAPATQPNQPTNTPASSNNSSSQQPTPTLTPSQRYRASQAIPEAVVLSGQLIYKTEDLTNLVLRASSGESIPTQVKRAARTAGMTPGQFILYQADLHKMQVPAPMRKRIQQRGHQSMGIEQSLVAMSPGVGPLSKSTGVLLDILTGNAPTYTRPLVG